MSRRVTVAAGLVRKRGVLALNVKPGDEVEPDVGRTMPDVEAYALGMLTLLCMDIAGRELGRPRVLC